MPRFHIQTLILAALVFGSTADRSLAAEAEFVAPAATDEQIQFFEKSVRPILAHHCWECHGEKKQEASLRLDSRQGVLTGSDTGAIVSQETLAESLILQVIQSADEDTQMPPDGKLSADEIKAIVRWIGMGFPWPPSPEGAEPVLSAEQLFQQARNTHWAFQPIGSPSLPEVSNPQWIESPIDRFVLARLEQAGLAPSPRADRTTLIRRVTFDLIGLPPSPDQVKAFLADERPDAYARLVDRLLASPRYGERWGRHWLDVARYADTRGYAFARERRYPFAYTYRDYVVRAFNEDLPFDQFILEQLAADRLVKDGGDQRPLAAMGFLTVGRRYNNVPDDIDDRIDVVSRGLLGLTVACARCHDHKYDPIPTEDYYSLYGVFASSTEPKEKTVIGESTDLQAFRKYREDLAKIEAELGTFIDDQRSKLSDQFRGQIGGYLAEIAGMASAEAEGAALSLGPKELRPLVVKRWRDYLNRLDAKHPIFGPWHRLITIEPAELGAKSEQIIKSLADDQITNRWVAAAFTGQTIKTRADVARVYGELFSSLKEKSAGKDADIERDTALPALLEVVEGESSPIFIPRAAVNALLARDQKNKLRELQRKIENHHVVSPGAPPRAMSLIDRAKPVEPRVFIRGNARRPGEQVPRQFLRVLSGDSRKPFTDGSGRLELARAIVADDNPLTARVLANRVWMYHFDVPLVSTPSDFGILSSPPTHPLLLDYMASSLRDNGWSLKTLHRMLLLSSTYQQSSLDRPDCRTIDPENQLIWRANRKRLELEPLRDALLAVADNLDGRMQGRPVELLKKPYTARRTMYGFVDRQDLLGLYRVFDFASPDQTSPQRPRTTVPQQALFLMNSPFAAQQAEKMARSIIAVAGSDAEQIEAIYWTIYGRPPKRHEAELGLRFLSTQPSTVDRDARWTRYAHALLMANEFAFID